MQNRGKKAKKMKEQLQHYELCLIIPGSTAEDKHPEILESVKKLLEKNKAQITHTEELGRKKLAYAIKNLRHGFYFIFGFDLLPKSLTAIEKEFKLNSDILRFLIIKKKVKTAEDIAQEEKIKTKKIKAEMKKQEVEEKEKKKVKPTKTKVSLEDLDKKLDELLDEKVI